jgi:Domain of Unknown Function with PDB structure (DUF3857)/Transglutaminase-like superfamily
MGSNNFKQFSENKFLILLFAFCTLFSAAFSQEKAVTTTGKISTGDFVLSHSNLIDSSTDAVILEDVGSTEFIGSKFRNWVAYVYKQHTRIKIIHKKAFDLATVKIRLYGVDKTADQLENLEASTFTMENNKLVETRLEKNDVFESKITRGVQEKKFTMPALQEGSIIEYSFQITSQRYYAVPSWSFQNFDYPSLHSAYEITIPNMLSYLISRHGIDSFRVNQTDNSGRELYKMATVNVTAKTTHHRWEMDNIPPFHNEDFIKSPWDCLDRIEFYLSQVYNGEDITDRSNTWEGKTQELLEDYYFGAAIDVESASFLSSEAKKITANDTSVMDIAKHVFAYVRDNYSSTGYGDIYLESSLVDVYKRRKGTSSEINLLLIAMLRQCKINADPVILATREKGYNPSEFPVMDKLNHVICVTWVNGEQIYLDASQPLNGFARLPIDCFNGHARIISKKNSGSVFFYSADIKELNMTTVFISNEGKGKIGGSYEYVPGFFGSDLIRQKVNEIGIKKYFENIGTMYGSDMTISKGGIDSLDQYDFPVRAHYDLEIPYEENSDIFYFTPVLLKSRFSNPLKAEERKFAVEMQYPIDNLYVLNMETPEGYAIDELPKPLKIAFNGNEGFFEYAIAADENNIQLRTRLKLNQAAFGPEEYKSLREFFAMVEKKQSEQIVFKKKK